MFFYLGAFTSCSSNSKVSGPFLDVEKACGEKLRLVEKFMVFNKVDFDISSHKDPRWGVEQTWDLKKSKGHQADLKWLQIKFEKGRLQSLWFGPRTTLEKDLKKIGLKPYDLKSKSGKELNSFDSGLFYIKDLNQRRVTVEHEGAPQKGTTVTCFKAKNR